MDAAGNYNGIEGRWNRFNSNIVDSGPTGGFEGYDSGSCGPPVLAGCRRGWRSLMREDEPYALRRRLFTTISKDVAPTPDIVKGIVPPLPNVSPIDLRLQQLWALGMDWPTLISTTSALATLPARPTSAFTDKFLVVPERIPPDWARPQQIDLNMSDPANPLEAKAAMVRYAAAAVYLALDGVASYQGIELVENPGTVGDDGLNREYLAWQFALNLVDYRDGDNEPSMAEWPVGSGRLLFGLEKQPFFTEAIASVVVGTGAGPIGPVPEEPPTSPDQWFHAVELYVPPYWQIPIVNLSLRPPGSGTGDIPLSTFVPALTAPALGSVLTGGPDGRYYIFCGPTTFAPGSITSSASFIANSYRNNAFRISSDPSDDRSVELVYSTSGGVGPETHALDVIGANYAGGEGAGTGCPGGSSEWATKGTTPTTGQRITTSLRRSTKGWRFDVAAHIAGREGPIAVEDPCSGFEETLGRANEFMASGSLDSRLPEVPWPGRALLLGGEPVDTFLASQPYSAFDTVGEISRIPMLGHIRKPPGVDTPVLDGLGLTGQELIPMSALIERIISRPSITGLPTALPERMAVGHPDFAEFGTINPWARRLVDFFTTSSHLFDGVDNDGDGVIDLRNGDATEGIDVVNAIAGRINLNTAPATVLRAVPYLSFLPSSTEYLDMEPGAGNHAADFVSVTNAGRFWDLSTAIVAARENREVPLRLWNSAAESMQVVANAIPSGGARTFANVADITGLSLVTDNSALPNAENRLYRYDRFADAPTSAAPLRLQNHKIVALDPDLGAQDPFSPDFRFKRLVGGDGIIDYSAIAPTLPVPPGYVPDNAGIRARDILLARASGSTTTRSDVFTAYIALSDEEGHYVARSQVTLDRSECFREDPESTVYTVNGVRLMVMPRVLEGSGRWGSYENERVAKGKRRASSSAKWRILLGLQ